MNIINLTPHDVVIENEEGKQVFKSIGKGNVPRIEFEYGEEEKINGITLTKMTVSGIKNLPPKREDTLLIVPAMISQQIKRGDLISPDTNNAKRNEKGFIESVPGFVQY